MESSSVRLVTVAPLLSRYNNGEARGSGSYSQPYGYLSELGAGSSGLSDFHARTYAPELGRFLSRDPVAGPTSLPQSRNPYAYGLGSPWLYPDPLGFCGLTDPAGCAGDAIDTAGDIVTGDPGSAADVVTIALTGMTAIVTAQCLERAPTEAYRVACPRTDYSWDGRRGGRSPHLPFALLQVCALLAGGAYYRAMGRGQSEIAGDAAPAQAFRRLEQRSPEQLTELVEGACARVAELGNWPAHIDPDSIVERVPLPDRPGSGFDAGIACALDLIPRSKQELAAKLHAAYTPQAVAKLREESKQIDPDSETAWWAAACHICEEGRLTPEQFREQLYDFSKLAQVPSARSIAAEAELSYMSKCFEVGNDGIPFSIADGGMQGAYIAGHEIAVMHDPNEDLYFIGTFHPSLGLENFAWSDQRDDLDRPRSGPVHGSLQYVRCHDHEELERALQAVRPGLIPNRPLFHVAPRDLRSAIEKDEGFWAGESEDLTEAGVYLFDNLDDAQRFQAQHQELGETDIWQAELSSEDGLALDPDPLEDGGWIYPDHFVQPVNISAVA